MFQGSYYRGEDADSSPINGSPPFNKFPSSMSDDDDYDDVRSMEKQMTLTPNPQSPLTSPSPSPSPLSSKSKIRTLVTYFMKKTNLISPAKPQVVPHLPLPKPGSSSKRGKGEVLSSSPSPSTSSLKVNLLNSLMTRLSFAHGKGRGQIKKAIIYHHLQGDGSFRLDSTESISLTEPVSAVYEEEEEGEGGEEGSLFHQFEDSPILMMTHSSDCDVLPTLHHPSTSPPKPANNCKSSMYSYSFRYSFSNDLILHLLNFEISRSLALQKCSFISSRIVSLDQSIEMLKVLQKGLIKYSENRIVVDDAGADDGTDADAGTDAGTGAGAGAGAGAGDVYSSASLSLTEIDSNYDDDESTLSEKRSLELASESLTSIYSSDDECCDSPSSSSIQFYWGSSSHHAPQSSHHPLHHPISNNAVVTAKEPKKSVKFVFPLVTQVHHTYHRSVYERKGQFNINFTPEEACEIRRELNQVKREMAVHKESRKNTHFYI